LRRAKIVENIDFPEKTLATNLNSPLQSQSKSAHYQNVTEIMTTKIQTIKPENTLYEAARLMGEKHIGSLIVMKYGTPVGIITEGDLLKVVSKGIPLEKTWIRSSPSICNQEIQIAMSSPLVKICIQFSLKDAARIMIEKRIRRLGICDVGDLVGIITTSDMIDSLPQAPENFKTWFEVDHFMSRKVVTTSKETLLEDAARIMAENHVGSVIVTDQEKSIGIFTERDLLSKFLAEDKSLIEEVGSVCSKPLITLPTGTTVNQAAAIMTKKHVKRLPVTKNGKIIGVLSARDLVEAYARG
jgi:CBS domain-containing protein